jgi:hypothetical protein
MRSLANVKKNIIQSQDIVVVDYPLEHRTSHPILLGSLVVPNPLKYLSPQLSGSISSSEHGESEKNVIYFLNEYGLLFLLCPCMLYTKQEEVELAWWCTSVIPANLGDGGRNLSPRPTRVKV